MRTTVREFLASYERKGASRTTVAELDSYLIGANKRAWSPLLPWTIERGFSAVADLTRDRLEAYLDETRVLVTPTVYFKVCCIVRLFLRYVVEDGFLPALPLQIARPKRLRPQVRVFTVEEMHRIRDVVRRENSRDWAIFLLLVDTGIRASELCSLKTTDIHWDREEVVIRPTVAKNRSFRALPLSASMPALRKYRQLRSDSTDRTDAFFLAYYSTPVFSGGPARVARRTTGKSDFSASPLTRMGLYQLVRKWGTLANITESRCSPHTFRHYFATQYLRRGGDIVTLQRILGHSRLDVTERYLKVAQTDVRRSHHDFSPALELLSGRLAPYGVRLRVPVAWDGARETSFATVAPAQPANNIAAPALRSTAQRRKALIHIFVLVLPGVPSASPDRYGVIAGKPSWRMPFDD